MEKKLKTLTLILRSLPPSLQTQIVEQLPSQVVEKLAQLEVAIDDELSEEDWQYFYNSWPEFAGMIQSMQEDHKKEEMQSLLALERPEVKDYMNYKLGKSEERPNLSSSITKIIDQVALGKQ